MRTLQFSATALLVASACSLFSSASARGDDFDALLADLSYSAVPSYARDAPATLQHARPADLKAGLQPAPSRRVASDDHAQARLMAPSANDQSTDSVGENMQFNIDAAMSAAQFGQSQTAASGVGFRGNSSAVGCGCDRGSCDGGSCDSGCASPVASCDRGCQGCRQQRGEEWVCVPKRPVNLPRSSFYQYFDARPSDVGVWDDYAQQPCKLYEGERPAPSHRLGCSGCGGCGEILEPCCSTPRVAHLPKIQTPEIRFPIRQIQPACDAVKSCDGCDSCN